MERRAFLKWAAGAAAAGTLAGCAPSPLALLRRGDGASSAPADAAGLRRLSASSPPQAHRARLAHQAAHSAQGPAPCTDALEAEPRSAWRADDPIRTRLQPMGAVRRVTVHHEGSPHGNWDVSRTQVARTLKHIQAEHRRRMRAGDIGYHYIIDRRGRVWEGRPHYFQGAHVAGQNAMNMGLMVLGNFEVQQPTPAQLASLDTLCHMLLAGYGIPAGRLYMHRELGRTCCPGKHLAPQVDAIRDRLGRG